MMGVAPVLMIPIAFGVVPVVSVLQETRMDLMKETARNLNMTVAQHLAAEAMKIVKAALAMILVLGAKMEDTA